MKIIRWIPAVLICTFIFSQSFMTASESSGLSLSLTEWISSLFFFIELETLHALVRKAAHFSEYFLLGCSVLYALGKQKITPFYLMCALAVPLCDECIQLFADGRSAQLSDCLIDAAGMMCAQLTISWLASLRRTQQ